MSALRLAIIGVCVVLFAVFLWINVSGYLIGAHLPISATGFVVGHDFVNVWMSGKAARLGTASEWFDIYKYNAAIHREFQFPAGNDFNWSYPPSLMLFSVPFSFLPYMTALVVFLCITFLCLVIAAPSMDMKWWLLLLLSPIAVTNIFAGQSGFLFAALIIGALTQLERKPILAGVLIGLLTIKPQIGFLFPVILLASRNWNALASATATTMVLFFATALIFGHAIWSDYFHKAADIQLREIKYSMEPWMHARVMPTPYMTILSLTWPKGLAIFVQAAVTLSGAVVAWLIYRDKKYEAVRIDIFILIAALATPYLWTYDLIAVAWVAINGIAKDETSPLLMAVSGFVLLIPYFSQPYPFGIPIVSILLEIVMLIFIAIPYLVTHSHKQTALPKIQEQTARL